MNVDAWITVTTLLSVIALVIQLGAYAAPLWVWMKSGTVYVGIGLWYVVGCQGTTCTSGTVNLNAYGAATQLANSFLVLRVLQSVALAGMVSLTVFLVVYKVGFVSGWRSMKTLNLAAFIIGVFTVIVLLGSAVVYGIFYWGAFLFVSQTGFDKSSIPWSPLMSLLAAIILIVVCAFILMVCRPKTYHGGMIPMSGDTKMELNPYVHNGMVNRYYNQTPYNDDRVRYVEDFGRHDDRYDSRYDNRAYQHDHEPTVLYSKPTARDFRENRDRELGHTIYTGNGFSYLKAEASRPDREEIRYARPVALADYMPSRNHYDEYFDRNTRGSRVIAPASTPYIYRPHQY